MPVGLTGVVGEEASGAFSSNTEYHLFIQSFERWLGFASRWRLPVHFENATLDAEAHHALATSAFSSTVPRTFEIAAQRRSVSRDLGMGRHVFHVQSSDSTGMAHQLDHYVVIDFVGEDREPRLSWYIDAGTLERLRPHLGNDWQRDERLAVRSMGDGRLIPVDEFLGYEMVPIRRNQKSKRR